MRRLCIGTLAVVFGCAAFAAAETSPLQGGLFQVRYADADKTLAGETLGILQEALAEFARDLPAGEAGIDVTICHSYQEFRQAAGTYGTAHVGGIAKSHAGVIVVKAPKLLPDGSDYRGMLRHELIHVLLARNTNEANVPRWFDEGVAMVVSREMRWESGMRIARMYVRRQLIPYPEMNLAFAPLGDEALFGDAYAQALSMTQYIKGQIGEARFWELVHALRGQSFERALRAFAGFTPATLYDAWRGSLWKVAVITSIVSGFSAFQLMAVLLLVAYWRKWRQGQVILQQWEEEESEPPVFSWEALEDDPYPWEKEDDDDDKEDRR